MKKQILAFIAAMLSVTLNAQDNPERGYVITNNNDTIYGMIDYRTDEMNTTRCTFKADGKDEYVNYAPGDILGYRFDKNGKLYVTKHVVYEDKMYYVFAEYMMKGMLNVYRAAGLTFDYIYFFENEKGETVAYRSYDNPEDFDKKIVRKNSQDLFAFIAKSSTKASVEVKSKPMNAKDILNIGRTYHEDVCTSGEDCIKYEYDAKHDDKKFTWYATVGVQHFFQTSVFSAKTYWPMLGLGFSYDMSRLAKDMSIFVKFDMEPEAVPGLPFWVFYNMKFGPKWKSKKGNGVKLTYGAGISSLFLSTYGVYAGIGVDVPIGKKLGLVADVDVVLPSFVMDGLFDHSYEWDKYTGCQIQASAGIRF